MRLLGREGGERLPLSWLTISMMPNHTQWSCLDESEPYARLSRRTAFFKKYYWPMAVVPFAVVLYLQLSLHLDWPTMERKEHPMSHWQPAAYKEYRWIVADPQLLGGKLAIRGTRLAVALILECLSSGMSLDDIDEAFDCEFPRQALPEVLKVASEFTDSFHVAA